MTECERIADQLERGYRGDAWHGPAVLETLKDLDEAAAHRRPIPAAHTVAELILHMAAWKTFVARALAHERIEMTTELDWPKPGAGAAGLAAALAMLERAHGELMAEARKLTDAALQEIPVAGGRATAYTLLLGAIQHDIYHAGQVALLRQAAASG
jgi:uncharacterized damage-inducible protein DinB